MVQGAGSRVHGLGLRTPPCPLQVVGGVRVWDLGFRFRAWGGVVIRRPDSCRLHRALKVYPQVDSLGLWHKFVNFGAGKSLGSPNE